MKFSDLIDKPIGFCGVDNNTFCIVTPDGERLAFEVVEDESDGYRSALEEVKPVPLDGLIFFRTPIATVTPSDAQRDTGRYGAFDGYDLVDEDGHRWLRIGTDNSDDYYPCFTFDYDPPKGLCLDHDDCRGEAEMARACVSSQRRDGAT